MTTGELTPMVIAIAMGALARFLALREDYRQYPSYPQGYLIHLVTGVVASALGAVAIPALLASNFTAVTFLSIAIQHFRDVRKMEKESLTNLESTEYAARGEAYIDGIAKTFESRNYFALIVSLITSAVIKLVPSRYHPVNLWAGVWVGFLTFLIIKRFSAGKTVCEIADIRLAEIEVRGAELYVDGFFISNLLGTSLAQRLVREEGIAVVVIPRGAESRVVMDNVGQHQAMLSEATRALGVRKYYFMRRNFLTGQLYIVLVPIIHDTNKLIYVLGHTPLLETVKKSQRMMNTEYLEE